MVEGFRFKRVSFDCLNFSFAMVSEWVGRCSVCTHTAKRKAFTFLSGIRPCNGTMEIEGVLKRSTYLDWAKQYSMQDPIIKSKSEKLNF